jgi:hypothetical protein
MRDIPDVVQLIDEVLGKTAAETFVENLDELTCFVRSLALNSEGITEDKMRSSLKKYVEGIIAASVKCYLDEYYMDEFGSVEVNVDHRGIYDKNMRPIKALEVIHDSHKEVMGLLVARGMYEFTKGRHLAKIMEARANSKQYRMITPGAQTREHLEVEVIRLERKLPNLTPEESAKLKKLYSCLRDEEE